MGDVSDVDRIFVGYLGRCFPAIGKQESDTPALRKILDHLVIKGF